MDEMTEYQMISADGRWVEWPDGTRCRAISGGWGLSAAAIIGYVSAAAAVAGTAVTTISAVQQAEAEERRGKLTSAALKAEAESARQAAEAEERSFRTRAALVLGKQRAITAAAGLETTSGSPLFQELESVRQAELEALNIRRTGMVSASGREFGARIARLQGRAAGAAVPWMVSGGFFKAGESILSQWAKRV